MARILGDSTSARKCLFHRGVYPAHARAARNRRSAACVVPGVMKLHVPRKVRQGDTGSHKRRCNAARARSAGSRSDRWARDRQRKRHTGRTCPGAFGAATKESRIQTVPARCRSAWVPRQTIRRHRHASPFLLPGTPVSPVRAESAQRRRRVAFPAHGCTMGGQGGWHRGLRSKVVGSGASASATVRMTQATPRWRVAFHHGPWSGRFDPPGSPRVSRASSDAGHSR